MNIKLYGERGIIKYNHYYLFITILPPYKLIDGQVKEVHIPDLQIYDLYLDTLPGSEKIVKIAGRKFKINFILKSHIRIDQLSTLEYKQLILNHPELHIERQAT